MKENSIEEDIKIIEYNMKCIRNVMNNFEDKLCENMQIKTDEVSKIIYNILSDYKRVLKENEYLKEKWDKDTHILRDELDLINANRLGLLQQNKELRKENEELKEYIAIAPNLDEMTAVKYRNIQQDAYIKGRAEEQQRAKQIIYENYIPVQKVKEKIRKNEEIIDISNDGDLIHELLQKNKVYEELLESEK